MFIGRFQNYLQYEKRYSGYTINAYIKDVEQFALFIGEEEAAFLKARHQDVRAWIVALMEELDARSINRKLSSLRTFYKFLNREGFINSNPMLLVKALKTSKPLPPVVHDAGLSELLDNDTVFSDDFSGLRDRLVLEMLFGTGMRLAELLALKESDVDFYEKRVKVLGKRSKERLIPINATLTAVIRNYIEQKKIKKFDNDSLVLILTDEGKAGYPKFVYRLVRKYLSLITTSEKRSPHVLRHSFATSLLNRGADLNAVKELLGHASLAATQVYTHNSVEKLKSIYKQAHPKA